MSINYQQVFEPPSYADSYNEGVERGYKHAAEGPEDPFIVVDSPGWVSGNLQEPYIAGWKAGVVQYQEEH